MHTLILSALLSAGADPEPITPPKGPPPQMSFLEAKGGKVTRTRIVVVPVTFAVKEKVVEGGVAKEVAKYVTKLETIQERSIVSLAKATITTAGGKKLTEADALKRLAGGAAVVLSDDGIPIEKAYLRAFKPDTLVIVIPPSDPLIEKKVPDKR
jgi:hypothetical protein